MAAVTFRAATESELELLLRCMALYRASGFAERGLRLMIQRLSAVATPEAT